MQRPLVSVITVVFNGDLHLQQAIDSVRAQSYSPIEYIVVDGGSSDKTLEIIKSNSDIITHWVSDPDDGIYDAMNKGICMSAGTYIGLLNADDMLLPDGVERLVNALESLDEPGYTCGAVELIDRLGRRYGTSMPLPENMRHKRRFLEMPCAHLGVFVHREIYERLGLFDTRFKLSADYDFVLRLMKARVQCADVPMPIGRFRLGGASGGLATWVETFSVHRKHGASRLASGFSFFRSLVKSNLARAMPNWIKQRLTKLLISKNHYE